MTLLYLTPCIKHFFIGTIYGMGLTFLQIIYESFDCDFFIHDLNK